MSEWWESGEKMASKWCYIGAYSGVYIGVYIGVFTGFSVLLHPSISSKTHRLRPAPEAVVQCSESG